MRSRRWTGAVLLLAAVAAAAGGLHNHADLARLAAAGFGPGTGRVLSSHSPLEKSAHWHAVLRVEDGDCVACHLHRFAAVLASAHGAPATAAGHFVAHAAPRGAALVFRLGDPTRGPPAVS